MSDDKTSNDFDLLERGIRVDPTLPPMTPTTNEPGRDDEAAPRVDQSDMPSEARFAPDVLQVGGERLTANEVAALTTGSDRVNEPEES